MFMKEKKRKKKKYHSFPCYRPTSEDSGGIIVQIFLTWNPRCWLQTDRMRKTKQDKEGSVLAIVHTGVHVPTGSCWETCVPTRQRDLERKKGGQRPSKATSASLRTTAVRVSPHHCKDLLAYPHALTGAWSYRMSPYPYGVTALQDVTESSQGHSSTGCHQGLAK